MTVPKWYNWSGFPGFLAALWYIGNNLWAICRAKVSDTRTVIFGILTCGILPCGLITLVISLLTRLACRVFVRLTLA